MMKFTVTLSKISNNKLNAGIINRHLNRIAQVAERNETFGFKAQLIEIEEPAPIHKDGEEKLKYTAKLELTKQQYRSEAAVQKQFIHILKNLKKKAEKHGWDIIDPKPDPLGLSIQSTPMPDTNLEVDPTVVVPQNIPSFYLPEFTKEVKESFFSGIYEREHQINIILDALKTAHRTGFESRSHVLLYGEPASAKSSVLLAFRDWLNTHNEYSVMSIDMPQATKAGCTSVIMERINAAIPPDVLILEEIEKINLESLSFLLSLMDLRGQINKVTARQRETLDAKMLVFATCNDTENLRKVHGGAVWSRFTFKMFCEKPSVALMKKILLREVKKIGGKPEWADKAYELGCKLEIKDVRQMIAMLAGGDRLLDGSFQADYIATYKA